MPPVGQIQAEDGGHGSQASEKDADVGLKLVYSWSRFRRSKESNEHDETPHSIPAYPTRSVCASGVRSLSLPPLAPAHWGLKLQTSVSAEARAGLG